MSEARDLIAHLAGPGTGDGATPAEMLRAIPEGGASVTDMAERVDTSRQAIYRGLKPFKKNRIIETDPYRRTGLAEVMLRVLAEATASADVDAGDLRFLAGSSHRDRVLSDLNGDRTKRDLTVGEDRPSRPTVHRIVSELEDRGWARDPSNERPVRTNSGGRVAESFASALTATDRALDRATLLRHLDDRVADIPLAGLAAAQQYHHTPANPDPAIDEVTRLAETEPEIFRGFMSSVSRKSADRGDQLIRSGTETELIVTEQVLRHLPTEGHYAEMVERGLNARNFSLLVAPEVEELPLELWMFEDRIVAVRPPKLEQALGDRPVGSVIGSDEELVTWAEQLYEGVRSRAQAPSSYVIGRIMQRISDATGLARGDGD
jgi:predicted transcriptional regulator